MTTGGSGSAKRSARQSRIRCHRRRGEQGAFVAAILIVVALLGVIGFLFKDQMLGSLSTAVRVGKNSEVRSTLRTNSELLLAEGSMDSDDVRLPVAMETTPPAGFTPPTGGGVIPATSLARKTDPYNTPYGYCAWNNGTSNGGAGYISGVSGAAGSDAVLAAPQLAVISAGPNRTIETTCAQAGANSEQGDDILVMMTVADAFSLAALWEPGTDVGTITYPNRVGINVNPPAAGYYLHVNGASYVQGALDVESTVDLRGDAGVRGNLSVQGTSTLAGANVGALSASSLTVTTGPNSVAGATTIANATITTADINAGTIDATDIGATTPGSGRFTSIYSSGTLEVDGTSQIDGAATFNSTSSFVGAATHTGTATFSNSATFNGTVALNGATTLQAGQTLSVGASLGITDVSGQARFVIGTDLLFMDGATTMLGLFASSDQVTINAAGGTSVAGGLTVASGNVSVSTGTIAGRGTLLTDIPTGGDLSGDVGSGETTSVTGLQGTAISTTAPGSGEVLAYDGSQWVPTTISGTGGGGGIEITETDPQVGMVTSNKWCRGDGSAIQCDQDTPLSATGTTDRLVVWTGASSIGSSFISISGTEADFTSGGSGGIRTDYLTYSSDARFKTDLKRFDDPLGQLRGLWVGEYSWSELAREKGRGGEARAIGILAQEIAIRYPSLVKRDREGYLSVDYARLTVPLLAALQQLDQEKRDLERRIEAIERRLGQPGQPGSG